MWSNISKNILIYYLYKNYSEEYYDSFGSMPFKIQCCTFIANLNQLDTQNSSFPDQSLGQIFSSTRGYWLPYCKVLLFILRLQRLTLGVLMWDAWVSGKLWTCPISHHGIPNVFHGSSPWFLNCVVDLIHELDSQLS